MDLLIIGGLILNTIGSIILAFSLSRTINMLNASVNALECFKDTFLGNGDIISFIGLDEKRKKVLKIAKAWTVAGVVILILGFVLQMIGVILHKPCP
jgi:uncharacterized protein YybS (DUF2232 family)